MRLHENVLYAPHSKTAWNTMCSAPGARRSWLWEYLNVDYLGLVFVFGTAICTISRTWTNSDMTGFDPESCCCWLKWPPAQGTKCDKVPGFISGQKPRTLHDTLTEWFNWWISYHPSKLGSNKVGACPVLSVIYPEIELFLQKIRAELPFGGQ